jgi:hypothetical protein
VVCVDNISINVFFLVLIFMKLIVVLCMCLGLTGFGFQRSDIDKVLREWGSMSASTVQTLTVLCQSTPRQCLKLIM